MLTAPFFGCKVGPDPEQEEMMKVLFVTSNDNKVPGVARVLAGYGVEVVQLKLEVPELQADTAEEVALKKAEWAFQRVGSPLFVADSAFHISALNGFPGTNVKWATKQIGPEGYLRLMSHLPDPGDRACYFNDAIVFIGGVGQPPRVFHRFVRGRLAESSRGGDAARAKSAVWKVFIPKGHDLTLAEMSDEEFERHRRSASDAYHDLGRWLQGRSF